MASKEFGSAVHVTHVGTATAVIELDHLTILTDPYFSPQGTVWTGASGAQLTNSYQPAMALQDLPPIDLVLLSHEDHKDNLDDLGRQLLDGRHVVTTEDGARKLAPRKGVHGLKPWETVAIQVAGGPKYEITGTPCVHLPGGQCIGFIVNAKHFGSSNGKPNVLYFSGDTIYMSELSTIKDRFSVQIALFNIGKASVPKPSGGGMLQITMDGEQAMHLARDIDLEVVVPMHFEGWKHFLEGGEALRKVLEKENVGNKFRFLEPGVRTKLV